MKAFLKIKTIKVFYDKFIVLGGIGQTYCHTHSNSLSNKMGNSLLAVRGINHKSIVVVGGKVFSKTLSPNY